MQFTAEMFTFTKEIVKYKFRFCVVNILNLPKVKNRDTGNVLVLFCKLWLNFSHCSGILFVNFENKSNLSIADMLYNGHLFKEPAESR